MPHYLLLLALAALGFAWTFACPVGNFWVKITTTVCVLCAGSFYAAGFPIRRVQHLFREAGIGVVAAVVLYGIFWLGDFIAASLFGFAPKQVEAIYAIKQLGHPWLVAGVLLLVTSPGEELFWRGYVLREAMKRWGAWRGFLAGAGIYGAVHIPSCNLKGNREIFYFSLFSLLLLINSPFRQFVEQGYFIFIKFDLQYAKVFI